MILQELIALNESSNDILNKAIEALEDYTHEVDFDEPDDGVVTSSFMYMGVQGIIEMREHAGKLQVKITRREQEVENDFDEDEDDEDQDNELDERVDEFEYTSEEVQDKDWAGNLIEHAENTMYA